MANYQPWVSCASVLAKFIFGFNSSYAKFDLPNFLVTLSIEIFSMGVGRMAVMSN